MRDSPAVVPLVGRVKESRRLGELVEQIQSQGGALLVRGDAGIGKSALLREASARAAERGMLVLSTTGVESEAQLPFAGLYQLLRPILAHVDELPGPQRDAVLGAFGVVDAPAVDRFVVALAALHLIGQAATHGPVVLIVEDANWLDRSSVDVLAFLARRLDSEPALLLAAMRDGVRSNLEGMGFPELQVAPLDADASAALLDAAAPDLPDALRERVLADAAGNPLALVELPIGLDQLDGAAALPAWLPLTTRLEQAFTRRVAGLPPTTRTMLLVAALNDGDTVSETLDAAAAVVGAGLTLDDLAPATAARLVDVNAERLRFRHPLMRSAIRQGSSSAQRHDAHAALAHVLSGDPDRQVWHRAASCTGPDDDVASGLDAAAGRAERRGAIEDAVAALERAARLSRDRGLKAVRLLRAAELAAELGRREVVAGLLRDTEGVELSLQQRARLAWIRDVFDDGIRDTAAGAAALADVAEQVAAEGNSDLALKLLWAAALRCFWVELGPAVRRHVVLAAERVPVGERDPRLLAILGFAEPIERGAVIVERLRSAVVPADDPLGSRMLGNAAMAVGAFDVAMSAQVTAVAGLRAQGRLGLLARALLAQASSALHLGDLGIAVASVAEGARLAAETEQPNLLALARAYEAWTAALRGDHEVVERLAAEAEGASLPVGARPVLALVQLARGLSALGDARHGDAYDHLRRMYDPADPACHLAYRCFAICFLSEAAVHCGRSASVAGVVADMEAVALRTPSPSLHAGLRFARAVLAADADAEELFEVALGADLTRWPFARGRAQLAYGAWLRRQRRTSDSRACLRSARETFDALGCVPWGVRARRELRASGETSHRRTLGAHEQLTPQELQIARMAADGLTNREIGERLYLSHRTVGTHLYRIFPKLGVTSRVALHAAIGPNALTTRRD